jgi:hypothetical protein
MPWRTHDGATVKERPHEMVKHYPQALTRQHDQTLRAGPNSPTSNVMD